MKARSLVAAAVALLLGPMAAWAAPTVVFTPSAPTVNTGDTLTITVGVSGLAAGGMPLSDYDLAVQYDTSLMSLTASPYTLDPAALSALGGAGNIFGLQVNGVNFFEDQTTSLLTSVADLMAAQSSGGSQVDGFPLFELSFNVLATPGGAPAAASFSLATVSSAYQFSPTLDVQDANGIITSYTPSASVCVGVNVPAGTGQPPCGVQPAPEPASYALVLVGLLAAGAASRKARTASKAQA